jgi:hypothetical protein
LYDLLKPHVTKLVVCDPRKNSRQGNKNDEIDARELSDRLYMNKLSAVYHGEAGVRALKELARSYLTISKDLARVMTRVKAIYRSWGIPCTGKQVYAPRHRAEWLGKISEVGVHRRAEFCYQQLDALRSLRHQVRRDLLAESKKHKTTKLLCQIPSIGPIRAALLIALIQTPYRFRTKRPQNYGRHLTTILLCWFQNRSASLHTNDENCWYRKPEPLCNRTQQPRPWGGGPEQILLNQPGCEARKIPADAVVFFLDFNLYRTYRN